MADKVNCREASRLLSLAFERRLSAAELQALEQHLDKCLMCRSFGSQLKFLHQASEKFRIGN